MDVTTPGIVLRKTPYTSSTVVVTIYTRAYGVLAFMARGVGGKRRQSSIYEPLTRLDLECVYKTARSLQRIKSASPRSHAAWSTIDPQRSAVSIFLSEMLQKSLREESPDEELFDFLESALDLFDEDTFNPNFHIFFLMRLTKFFGFFPRVNELRKAPYFDLLDGINVDLPNHGMHTLSGEESALFMRATLPELSNRSFVLSKAERRALLQLLVTYYQLHFEGFGDVKSLKILMEIFE